MKKFLFMAVAALALIACGGQNSPELPAKDKKALATVTAQAAVQQLGASSASLDKYLKDAGYSKVEGVSASAPKKLQGKVKAPAATESYAMYVYGVDPKAIDAEGEAGAEYLNAALKKGNSVIIVYVVYADDKMVELATSLIVNANKYANQKYVTLSDECYATLPESALMVNWSGATEIAGKEAEYTKHADFDAALIGAENAAAASEMGYAITSTNYDGFAYVGEYENPDEAAQQAQKKDGYEPYAVIITAVLDLSLLLN